MIDESDGARLEREIQEAKREFDAAIGNPEALQAAWIKLSRLVNFEGEVEGEGH